MKILINNYSHNHFEQNLKKKYLLIKNIKIIFSFIYHLIYYKYIFLLN